MPGTPTRERAIAPKIAPERARETSARAIVSPCSSCPKNIPVPANALEQDQIIEVGYETGFPCPKQKLYALARELGNNPTTKGQGNFDHIIYDESLRKQNPVWPGQKKGPNAKKDTSNNEDEYHQNGYAYVFVATYQDNVNTGWNPDWDTSKIICQGPFLIKTPERQWNFGGHLEEGDTVWVDYSAFHIAGGKFKGLAEEGIMQQVAKGYMCEIDRNLLVSFSAV